MKVTSDIVSAVSSLTQDGFCLCEMVTDDDGNPVDYRFLEVNHLFEEYTGLKNAKGKTALELVPDLERHWVEAYARVGLGRENLRFENGSVPMGRWFEVYATPVEPHGRFAIVFKDVSERKTLEREREVALEHSRRLFDELSHRVKNSLAIVNSIVSTEARLAPPEGKAILARVGSRVSAIGDLYEAMSLSGSIDEVDARKYLLKIVDHLQEALVNDARVTIEADVTEMTLSSRQAVSLGLILNELVTNSVKHAFAPGQKGLVRTTLRTSGDGGDLQLIVSDNGTGEAQEADGAAGLGTKLVAAFVSDLDGRLARQCSDEGTRTTITFAKHHGMDDLPGQTTPQP